MVVSENVIGPGAGATKRYMFHDSASAVWMIGGAPGSSVPTVNGGGGGSSPRNVYDTSTMYDIGLVADTCT